MSYEEGLLKGTTDTYVPITVGPGGSVQVEQGDPFGLPYVKFLTAALDGTGPNNLNGNYSGTATDFGYTVPAGHEFIMHSLAIQISSNTTLSQIDYGGINPSSGGLANGVSFYMNSGGVDIPLLASQVVNVNMDWFRFTHDIFLMQWSGGPQTLAVAIYMIEDFGTPLVISAGNIFKVRLHDDLRALVYHSFAIRGILRPTTPSVSRTLVRHYV